MTAHLPRPRYCSTRHRSGYKTRPPALGKSVGVTNDFRYQPTPPGRIPCRARPLLRVERACSIAQVMRKREQAAKSASSKIDVSDADRSAASALPPARANFQSSLKRLVCRKGYCPHIIFAVSSAAAILPSLGAGECDALNKSALGEEERDDQRQSYHRRGRHQQVPLAAVTA